MSVSISLYNYKTGSIDLVSIKDMIGFTYEKNKSHTELWTHIDTSDGSMYMIKLNLRYFLKLRNEVKKLIEMNIKSIRCNPYTLKDCVLHLVSGDTLEIESLTELISLIDDDLKNELANLEKAKTYIDWDRVLSISINPKNKHETTLLFNSGMSIILDNDIDEVLIIWQHHADNFNKQSAGFYEDDDLYVIYNKLYADQDWQIH